MCCLSELVESLAPSEVPASSAPARLFRRESYGTELSHEPFRAESHYSG